MLKRELKYHKWLFKNDKLILFDKRLNNNFTLDPTRRRSLARFIVSVDHNELIVEKRRVANNYKLRVVKLKEEKIRLKKQIKSLRERIKNA